MRTIANILTQQRKQKGITLTQLAEASRISQSHLEAIENGVHKPTIPTVFRICEALALDPVVMADMLSEDFKTIANRRKKPQLVPKN